MLKIRRSLDRLVFNMEIPIPGKGDLQIEMEPWRGDVPQYTGASLYKSIRPLPTPNIHTPTHSTPIPTIPHTGASLYKSIRPLPTPTPHPPHPHPHPHPTTPTPPPTPFLVSVNLPYYKPRSPAVPTPLGRSHSCGMSWLPDYRGSEGTPAPPSPRVV